jgi:septum site-determining protein MinC
VANWQQEQHEMATAYLLDFSPAVNSVQAFQLLDEFLLQMPPGSQALVDINASDLLLTRGVMTKIRQQLRQMGLTPNILYATLPQTQQAALDEGLMVKEKLGKIPTNLRQPYTQGLKNMEIMGDDDPIGAARGVELPLFPIITNNANQPGMNAPRNRVSSVLSLNRRTEAVFEVKKETKTPAAPYEEKSLSSHAASTQSTQMISIASQAQATFDAVPPQSSTIPELASVKLEEPQKPSLAAQSQDVSITGENTTAELREVEYSDAALKTLYWRQNLRSGQTVRFEGNIVIVGDVHAGSEVTASGDILVWGELRGVAHAGAQGNYKAEIRAMRIEALQLRIADYIARRPDRIYYHKEDGDSVLAPELARVGDGEIKIYKTRPGRI